MQYRQNGFFYIFFYVTEIPQKKYSGRYRVTSTLLPSNRSNIIHIKAWTQFIILPVVFFSIFQPLLGYNEK